MGHEHSEQYEEPAGDFHQPEDRSLAAAASYVAGSAGAGGQGHASGQTFSTAFRAICQWGQDHHCIVEEREFPFFLREPDGQGDEHQAWFDEPSNRWFKATHVNRFGLAWGRDGSATAGEYLRRLVLQNHYFGDDIRLIALVNCGGKLRVLTSQPHIAGEAAPYDEIQSWLASLGFVRLHFDERIAWYRPLENLLLADAHEGNVIKTQSGELVPIDLNITQPLGELLEWAREMVKNACASN